MYRAAASLHADRAQRGGHSAAGSTDLSIAPPHAHFIADTPHCCCWPLPLMSGRTTVVTATQKPSRRLRVERWGSLNPSLLLGFRQPGPHHGLAPPSSASSDTPLSCLSPALPWSGCANGSATCVKPYECNQQPHSHINHCNRQPNSHLYRRKQQPSTHVYHHKQQPTPPPLKPWVISESSNPCGASITCQVVYSWVARGAGADAPLGTRQGGRVRPGPSFQEHALGLGHLLLAWAVCRSRTIGFGRHVGTNQLRFEGRRPSGEPSLENPGPAAALLFDIQTQACKPAAPPGWARRLPSQLGARLSLAGGQLTRWMVFRTAGRRSASMAAAWRALGRPEASRLGLLQRVDLLRPGKGRTRGERGGRRRGPKPRA
jgi:hypothetical protein